MKKLNTLKPISYYSKPLHTYQTKLGTLFEMAAREHAAKPNRSMKVIWNAEIPLVANFENQYSYFVTFFKKDAAAGNHYHRKKQEIIYPVVGNFTVLLEDVRTKEKESVVLDSDKHTALYVSTHIAHTVLAQKPNTVIIITASTPSSEEDEIPYILNS